MSQIISATIVTRNEEANIADCLAALDWVEEILVIDDGSDDRTVEIAREGGAKVLVCEGLGYAGAKNRAIDESSGDWILSVDADERVTPALRAEIEAAVASENPREGYLIPRANHFAGRRIRHGGWWPDHVLRLVRRGRGRFNDRAVHEAIELDGEAGRLRGPLLHYTYSSVADYLERMNRYSRLWAEDAARRGRRATALAVATRPVATFLKMYLLQAGILDGGDGLMLASLYACYTASKYARLRELSAAGGDG